MTMQLCLFLLKFSRYDAGNGFNEVYCYLNSCVSVSVHRLGQNILNSGLNGDILIEIMISLSFELSTEYPSLLWLSNSDGRVYKSNQLYLNWTARVKIRMGFYFLVLKFFCL